MTGFEQFHFIRPLWLLALIAIPIFVWLARARGSAAGDWQRVCDRDLLAQLLVDETGRARRWPVGLLSAGFAATCIALAGPTYERLPQPAYNEPTDTVAVLPLTPSLNARDIAPSRLARARFELQDLLEQAEGTVGLVIYAEEAYPVTPLTDDPKVVQEMIPVLEPGLMPGRGARLDRGIDEAATLLGNAGAVAGRIVLLTDGPGDSTDAAIAAAKRARGAGHTVSVLSLVGDSSELTRIAAAGGGVNVPIRHDDMDITQVLAVGAAGPSDLGALRASDVRADVWRDLGVFVVLIPLMLAPLAFRRGWAGALGLLFVLGAASPREAEARIEDWWQRPDQQGAEAFEAGEHSVAAERFEDPEWQGVSQYRSGDYAAAIETLGSVETTRAQYNLGNALAQTGQLEAAIAAYDAVLEEVPGHEDAKHNREIVQSMLDQQQQEQQQNQQGQPDSSEPQEGEGSQQSDSGDSQQEPSEGQQGQGDEGQSDEAQAASDSDEENATGDPDQEPSNQASADAQSEEGQERSGQETSPSEPEDAQAGTEHASADRDPAANEDEIGEENAGQQMADAPTPDRTGQEQANAEGAPAPSAWPEQESGESEGEALAGAETDTPMDERSQEIEHMLSRVPDDPGGLLKEKLRRRYAEKQGLSFMGPGGRR